MSHDITHCTNDNCQKRFGCHRYLMWLRLTQLPTGELGQTYSWTDGKSCVNNEYFKFWEAKQPASYVP